MHWLGAAAHPASHVAIGLKIICLEICSMMGVFSKPPARRERRKLIAYPEAGILKGTDRGRQHPAVAISFFVLKKKNASPDFESSYCFFLKGKKKMKALPTISF